MPTSRRPGPGDKPRRPRVAGTRKRSTPGKYGGSGSDTDPISAVVNSEKAVPAERIHHSDSATAPAAKPADPVTESVPVDHQDLTADEGDCDGGPVVEPAAVTTWPVKDDTDAVTNSATNSGPYPVVDIDATAGRTAQVASSGRTVRLMVTAVLLVLTVVCAALSFWFLSEENALHNEGPGANQALTDPAATSEVKSKITGAVQQVFSYDFTNTAKTENAAKNLLVGPATQQYNELYAVVKQLVPQQKLVLTTSVQASAVTMLQGDRAQLLLIVNQVDTRTDTGQSNSDTAQLSIGAVKQGNDWKIEQITQR